LQDDTEDDGEGDTEDDVENIEDDEEEDSEPETLDSKPSDDPLNSGSTLVIILSAINILWVL
jgi:hypothetical protein